MDKVKAQTVCLTRKNDRIATISCLGSQAFFVTLESMLVGGDRIRREFAPAHLPEVEQLGWCVERAMDWVNSTIVLATPRIALPE